MQRGWLRVMVRYPLSEGAPSSIPRPTSYESVTPCQSGKTSGPAEGFVRSFER